VSRAARDEADRGGRHDQALVQPSGDHVGVALGRPGGRQALGHDANMVSTKIITEIARSVSRPKTIWKPSPDSRSRWVRSARARAAGRGRTPVAMRAAETPKVTTSMASAAWRADAGRQRGAAR